MSSTELFPLIEPYETGFLKVDDLHTLYWEQSGNPNGVPVVCLHGGPGSGSSPEVRRFFDPAHYRIVLFDQRGAGKSAPLGETRQNTTELLVQDMEALRTLLGIERWHLFGGSWGSTLALAYAQSHPDRCLSMTMWGIFLMRPHEIDWFVNGIAAVHPEALEILKAPIPAVEYGNLLEAYYHRLHSLDPVEALFFAKQWSMYEGGLSTLLPNPDYVKGTGEDNFALGRAQMETHYFRNNLFQPPERLLRNVEKIRHIPATIVQGRYDMVCPFKTAWELHKAWPEAEFVVVNDAGHSRTEPSIRGALLTATERFKNVLGS